MRRIGILLVTLAVVCGAMALIAHLLTRASEARDAQLQLIALRLDVAQTQDVPWGAAPGQDKPADVRDELLGDVQEIRDSVAQLQSRHGLPEEQAIERPFNRSVAALWQIFRLVSHGKDTGAASEIAAREAAKTDEALQASAKRYRRQASAVLVQAQLGAAGVILALFAAFAWFYSRVSRARRTAQRLAGENQELLVASRHEALTDALTGLGNRRALMSDLRDASGEAMLALFDLDGFKNYNDSFGHGAGDALLARLGERLAETMDGMGAAYRMGGDEFCIVSPIAENDPTAIAALAASALTESGEGFRIGCSYGISSIPADTRDPDVALLLADQRMYEQKTSSRVPPGRQTRDVLLRVLAERSSALGQHTSDVSGLSARTAHRLGLDDEQVEAIRLGAELHDIGKAAVPDAILNKPEPLNPDEWEFIRRHTVIGERIVRAAPSLAHTAELVRSHHERHDGTGYPDGLPGDKIPLGARIIAVSDAFDAMTTDRPYRAAISTDEAVAELRRCSGTQFDPQVVEAFVAELASVTLGNGPATADRARG